MATNIHHTPIGTGGRRVTLIDNPQAALDDLLRSTLKALIFNRRRHLRQRIYWTAYAAGRGGVVTRGVAEIVEGKKGKHQIVITKSPRAQ